MQPRQSSAARIAGEISIRLLLVGAALCVALYFYTRPDPAPVIVVATPPGPTPIPATPAPVAPASDVVPAPPPVVEVAPPGATPRPLDLAAVAQTPALWPRQVTLLQPASFRIVVNGGAAGSVTAPAGTAVRLLRVVGPQVEVEFQNVKQLLAAASTDLMPRALANFRAAPPSPPPVVAAGGESPNPPDEVPQSGPQSQLPPGPDGPPVTVTPENLKSQFALIQATYAKVDAAKRPKQPADTVWLFRSKVTSTGTVEVAFQGAEVVYMIFRRGAGGSSMKPKELFQVHFDFHETLLKETYDPLSGFSRYNHEVTSQINAGVIFRKDFNVKVLLTGS